MSVDLMIDDVELSPDVEAAPWEDNGDTNWVADASKQEELEVVRKSRKFKKLSLISGCTIDKPLDQFVADRYGKEGTMRLKLARFLLGSLGYRQSDDVLLTLSCTKPAKVVIATAGAGKTTSLQFDIAISKMLDKALGKGELEPQEIEDTGVKMSRILYLNYNRHNRLPIIEKHTDICSKVNALIKERINDDIDSNTVHALCRRWLQAAIADEEVQFELPSVEIMTEDSKKEIWTSIYKPRWKKFYGDEPCMITHEVLDELHNFKTESMLEWDAFFETAKFVDTGLNSDFVKSCLQKYESMKKQLGAMDFIDYLTNFVELLKTNDRVRERLQSRYSLIIADENQDFTALMNELLLQLHNPEKNRLIVVGDPDQVIYAFKGVSPVNVVDLLDRLPDADTLGLDTNYRCPDNIIAAAKNILNLNILRFDKPLFGVKTGGEIVKVPLKAEGEQAVRVLDTLKRIGPEDYKNTVLSYRNNKTSIILGEELYYAGIPFKVIDTNRPFNNKFFKHVYSGLMALHKKESYQQNKCLFRFLPVSKAEWCEILDLNMSRRHAHLYDLQMPVNSPKGLKEAFAILVEIAKRIDTEKCSSFVEPLLRLYHKYYFDFIVHSMSFDDPNYELYNLQVQRLEIFFKRDLTFKYMNDELTERNVDSSKGVTLSTFHGLKGLEFDYVLAADFNETVFPNWENIDIRYSANTAIEERESENRLAYVLVTRTIKTLYLYYLENDPSVYVDILCGSGGKQSGVQTEDKSLSTSDEEVLQLGSIGASSVSMASRMDFIQRMTGKFRT